jgi:hypothetical protein
MIRALIEGDLLPRAVLGMTADIARARDALERVGWVSLGVSFSRQISAFRSGNRGTDARFTLESRHFVGLGRAPQVLLDQESPGSSPGGAMAGATAPACLFGARASTLRASASGPGGQSRSSIGDLVFLRARGRCASSCRAHFARRNCGALFLWRHPCRRLVVLRAPPVFPLSNSMSSKRKPAPASGARQDNQCARVEMHLIRRV